MRLSWLMVMWASFWVGLLVHIVWWRWSRPRDDARALLAAIVLLPVLSSILACAFFLGLREWALLDAVLLAGMFHLATGLTYMSLYTAAQAASPTSLILLRVAAARTGGATEEELRGLFTWRQLAGDSLDSAIDERFLVSEGGCLRLGPRGRILIRVCSALRSLLALPPGRG